jgi:hypothetical protein
MNLAPGGNAQKAAVVQRKLLSANGDREFFVRNFMSPFHVSLIQLQALGIEDGWAVREILGRELRNAVIGGPGYGDGFSLGERGKSVKRRRLVTEGRPKGRSISGCRKRRAVTFKRLEAKANAECDSPFLKERPERAWWSGFLRRLIFRDRVLGRDTRRSGSPNNHAKG